MPKGLGYILGWEGPREFDCGHVVLWLCQMVYAKVILSVQIK